MCVPRIVRGVWPRPRPFGQQLTKLPLASITDLSEALFDFSTVADLQTWLSGHPPA
jgi:hypothetical protein